MKIVVTGATGLVGRPLVGLLREREVEIRAVARSSATWPRGVAGFTADLAEPATLLPVLDGADALFVHPRAVGDNAGKLLALAGEAGVRRVVVLSAINVDDDPAYQPSRLNGDRNKEVEEAAVLAEVLGRSLVFQEVPAQAAVRGMVANGLREEFVTALMNRYERGAGQPAEVTDEVRGVLGRPARTFAQWVADHATAFGDAFGGVFGGVR